MPESRRVAVAVEIDQPYPHHQDVFLGVQRYVREHRHWQCVIDEHPDDAFNRRRSMAPYDGVIARATPAMHKRIKRMGIPLVNVVYAYHTPGVAGVFPDPYAMGQQAADHLIDRGFPRLLALVNTDRPMMVASASAFAKRAEQLGVACQVADAGGGVYRDRSAWRQLVERIYDHLEAIEPPTGIFTQNAPYARLLVQYARALGLHVPQDLAVICHHNLDLVVNVPPQITSFDANYERVGYEAAALLERLMDGAPVPDKPIFLPPRGIVGRETTDYFAVEDELVGQALRYISSRLREKLRVEDIAYALNVSTRLLQIRFSNELGVGVSEEIRRLRLEKAKRLLAEPDRLITSIPKEVGFATLYVMNQVFHRELGMTPSDCRKKQLGDR